MKQKQRVKTRIYIYLQQIIYPPVYYTKVVKINYWTEFRKNFAYKFNKFSNLRQLKKARMFYNNRCRIITDKTR